tara:strand:- start:111 stop:473 length:363 start_codon:yes stop_codon:yes gene_type:complete
MAINNDVDVLLALHHLGKKPNVIGLTQSIPPHSINVWEGGDAQPTDDQINQAWTDYKAAQAAIKYKADRTGETKGVTDTIYPSLGDQLDNLYKDIIAGKVDATGEFAKAIKATKDKYPKP